MTPPPAARPADAADPADPADDRYYALGQVVERAAVMEIALRLAFCALMGGPNAAVVASDQETHWLIENCDALTRQHQDIPAVQRDAIRVALRACREANHDRNRLVHDAWGTGPDGAPAQMKSLRHSYQIAGREWSAEQIRTVADASADAQHGLLAAVEDALGPASLQVAEQLLVRRATGQGG
jgi:hypothetical protein